MARRIHVPVLIVGDLRLDRAQAHHARDVLRLETGTLVEVFDDAGATAKGILLHHSSGESDVRIEGFSAQSSTSRLEWMVAAAVPKGERADWMVEKLSELGAAAFTPIATARSVVLPQGKNKRERWTRIATEAAKQSRRSGVMKIEELTTLETALGRVGVGLQSGTRARDPESNEKHSSSGVQKLQVRKTPDSEVLPRAGSPGAESGSSEYLRTGVIGEERVAPVPGAGWFLTTELPGAIPISQALDAARVLSSLTLFIGPEGGWTEQELAASAAAGLTPVRLGPTILRIETAAICAGAIVACCLR